tara:strand:- start:289 stop:411 length:123 start_codon:yes stop_codon:yes gene_type:complete
MSILYRFIFEELVLFIISKNFPTSFSEMDLGGVGIIWLPF